MNNGHHTRRLPVIPNGALSLLLKKSLESEVVLEPRALPTGDPVRQKRLIDTESIGYLLLPPLACLVHSLSSATILSISSAALPRVYLRASITCPA